MMHVRFVHGRCTNRTLMMYEWYMAVIRNKNQLFNTTSRIVFTPKSMNEQNAQWSKTFVRMERRGGMNSMHGNQLGLGCLSMHSERHMRQVWLAM